MLLLSALVVGSFVGCFKAAGFSPSSFVRSSRLTYRRRLRYFNYVQLSAGTTTKDIPTMIDGPDHFDVIIVGSGLVGSAIAAGLVERGLLSASHCNIKVYEKRNEMQRVGAAIGLYPNGRTALRYLCPQVDDYVQQWAIPSRYFERRDLQDNVLQVTDVQQLQTTTSPVYFPWYLLQQKLLDAVPSDSIIEYGKTFDSYRVQPDGTVRVSFTTSSLSPGTSSSSLESTTTTVSCRVLIGADGIFSAVRKQLLNETRIPLHYYGKVMYRAVFSRPDPDNLIQALSNNSAGYLYCPPPGTQISYQGDTSGQSFSFRETAPGIMTITAAARLSGEPSIWQQYDPQFRKQRFQGLFAEYPKAVQDIIKSLNVDSIHEDYVRDVTIPSFWSDGPVVICGDAAHAMTPYMGQGANMGLEDASVLVHLLEPLLQKEMQTNNEKGALEITKALAKFQRIRMERVTRVQEQSRRNAIQSSSFDKESAAVPFVRRKYTKQFQADLYDWSAPTNEYRI